MISEEQIEGILAAWDKHTPEEKARIREQAARLRAESSKWGPFYGGNFRQYHRYARFPAGVFRANPYGRMNLPEGANLEDGAWPALELAILEELQNPKALAWDRACKYLIEALEDPDVKVNPETVKVINSWLTDIDTFGYGHETSAIDVAPPVSLIREVVRSWDAGEKASKKNAEPRAWVLTEWESRPDLGQSKASFARQYVPLVKQRFGVLVTEDTIKRDWLPKSAK